MAIRGSTYQQVALILGISSEALLDSFLCYPEELYRSVN